MQNFKEAAISAADQMIEALEHEKRSLNHKIFSRERTLIHVSVPVSHINSSLLSLRKSKERVWNNFFLEITLLFTHARKATFVYINTSSTFSMTSPKQACIKRLISYYQECGGHKHCSHRHI